MVTIGRIVRYVHVPQDCNTQAVPKVSCAIVTNVRPSGHVDLCVFFSIGQFVKTDVPYSLEQTPDSWHWAEGEINA